MKKSFVLLTAIIMTFLGTACQKDASVSSSLESGIENPYRYKKHQSSEVSDNSSNTESKAEETAEVSAVKVMDSALFAKRIYELKTFFGVESFSDPAKIPITAVVYYSFCHIYYPTLLDMPDGKLVYRKVSVEKMNEEIKKNFLLTNFDATKSDLYSSKNYFEMWQPKFKGNPVFDTAVKELASNKYELTVTFYAESDTAKKTPVSKSVAVIQKNNDYLVFSSLSTSKM